jgi:anti-anti-sigma regulatory factor
MLKITITETPTERRFIVQGRLVGPWVEELNTAWKRAQQDQDGRTCVIDLNDATFIDKSGVRLLRTLWENGAQLVATGVYAKHLLEEVEQQT